VRRDKNRNAKTGGFYFVQDTAGNIRDRQNNGGNINIIRGADIYQFTLGSKAIRTCTAGCDF
jgi:dihydrofolate reductase